MHTNDIIAKVHGLEHWIPYNNYTEELYIADDSSHRIVLLDKDRKVTSFLTDRKLKEFDFDEGGKLIKR